MDRLTLGTDDGEGPGFGAVGFLGQDELTDVLDRCGTDSAVRQRYGIGNGASGSGSPGVPRPVRGAMVAALAYGEGDFPAPSWVGSWDESADKSRVCLARFVRADWYAEMTDRLKRAARRIDAHVKKEVGNRYLSGAVHEGESAAFRHDWRCLSNSRLPEKALAVAAGLGFLGRNSLLVVSPDNSSRPHAWSEGLTGVPASGPGVILGVLLMPVDPGNHGRPLAGSDIPGGLCGDCRACVAACPTQAILDAGGISRTRCIQHWSAIPGDLPETISRMWGKRLYGCDICIEACPRFKTSVPHASLIPVRGILGPSLPAAFFIGSPDTEIRRRLRGTALGMGWMPPEAFRRNAILASRNR